MASLSKVVSTLGLIRFIRQDFGSAVRSNFWGIWVADLAGQKALGLGGAARDWCYQRILVAAPEEKAAGLRGLRPALQVPRAGKMPALRKRPHARRSCLRLALQQDTGCCIRGKSRRAPRTAPPATGAASRQDGGAMKRRRRSADRLAVDGSRGVTKCRIITGDLRVGQLGQRAC